MLWAFRQGRVFLWQIYFQEVKSHYVTQHAFWQRCEGHVPGIHAACDGGEWQASQALSAELNGVRELDETEREQAWAAVLQQQAQLMAVLQLWRGQLWQQQSLATQLANFMRLQLK